MFSDDITIRVKHLLAECARKQIRFATAESCTGGLIAAYATAIPGSSEVFECGFITYSNHAKEQMLSVDPALIQKYGAVSEPVANAMAQGALVHSRASLAIATTGIAGPDGATPEKPVGLVHITVLHRDGHMQHEAPVFTGTRHDIRTQAAMHGIDMMTALLNQCGNHTHAKAE